MGLQSHVVLTILHFIGGSLAGRDTLGNLLVSMYSMKVLLKLSIQAHQRGLGRLITVIQWQMGMGMMIPSLFELLKKDATMYQFRKKCGNGFMDGKNA